MGNIAALRTIITNKHEQGKQKKYQKIRNTVNDIKIINNMPCKFFMLILTNINKLKKQVC